MAYRLTFVLLGAVLIAAGAACQTTQEVAFVNPTEQPLFVQVDERTPFEVPPGDAVTTTLPALNRLTPIAITARDASGATVFFRSTSLPRLQSAGNRVELLVGGEPVNPYDTWGNGY